MRPIRVVRVDAVILVVGIAEPVDPPGGRLVPKDFGSGWKDVMDEGDVDAESEVVERVENWAGESVDAGVGGARDGGVVNARRSWKRSERT